MAEGEDRVSALAPANHLRTGLSDEGKFPDASRRKSGTRLFFVSGFG